MPLLIGHLHDQRLYATRQEVPASAMNAPVTAPAPVPMTVRIPVGQICQDLLYEQIMPEYISPYAGNFKPFSSSIFMIHDWPRWWQANQHKTLAQIRQELEARVDRYWLEHGMVQLLDPEN